MEDQSQDSASRPRHGGEADQRSEPVRTRWTPKPDQILILESIFNSGMVNPPKDETVRIRKLLEKFGPVGDANVFYWFQNRRSRARRRQRQIQACLGGGGGGGGEQLQAQSRGRGGGVKYENYAAGGFEPNCVSYPLNSGSCIAGSSSSSSSYGLDGSVVNNSVEFLSFSGYSGLAHEYEQNPIFAHLMLPAYPTNLVITVFINGVAAEIKRGPLDAKAMFGEGLMLFHSSGIPVQVNEHGFLVQGLQHGESYFLVPRHS